MFVPFGEWPHPAGLQLFDNESALRIKASFESLLAKARRAIDAMGVGGTRAAVDSFDNGAPIYQGHPDDSTKKNDYPDKKAYGWVTGVRIEDNGATFEVEMNEPGLQLVKDKSFLYYSPFWNLEPAKDRRSAYRPVSLISIGLTNNPNIPVPPMANEAPLEPTFAEIFGAAVSGGFDAEYDFRDTLFALTIVSAANDFDPGEHRDYHGMWTKGGEVEETTKSREAKEGESYREATPEDRKRLGIAPGYKEVRVTDDPKAEKLWKAKTPDGKDKAGYSEAYQKENEGAKWKRVEALHHDYGKIKSRVDEDIKAGGKDAHPAMAVKLMNRTGLRNGGEGETKIKGSTTGETAKTYGASSLKTSHASTEGDKVHLDFQGKDNIRQQHSFTDPQLAAHIRDRQAGGHDKLFDTTDSKTRDYLNKISGDKYKVHDLRTYHGTALASKLIHERGGMPSDPKAFKKAQMEVATKVSHELGNGPSMALKNYIHPAVWHA